jgi:hypothetical protein
MIAPVPNLNSDRGALAALAVCVVMLLASCGEQGVDSTPQRLDGSSSNEFESGDIERANSASDAVRAYCAGAVSEAQEVGCLSHVDESDIP